jgi:hypothetical protein
MKSNKSKKEKEARIQRLSLKAGNQRKNRENGKRNSQKYQIDDAGKMPERQKQKENETKQRG